MPTSIRNLLLCAVLALLIAPATSARAQDSDVDVGYFYEQLEPYGRWIEHPRWGDVWSPDTDPDWQPYARGYWNYTEDYGWYWMSDEPFGWAVFHYGRWVLDEDDGWLWIPGTEWAAAWVTWRSDDRDDGLIGWAPLSPASDWGPDGDIVYDQRYYEEPRYASMWIFVRPAYMIMPDMYRYAVPRPQNLIYLRRTAHLHAYRRFDQRVFNGGLELRRFERLVGRPVPRLRLNLSVNPRDRDFRVLPGGLDLRVFRPNIIERRDGQRPRPVFRTDRPRSEPGSFGRRPDVPGGNFQQGKGVPDNRARQNPGGPPDFGKNPGVVRERGNLPDVGKSPEIKGGPKVFPPNDAGRERGPGDFGKSPGVVRERGNVPDVGKGPEIKGGTKTFPPNDAAKEPRAFKTQPQNQFKEQPQVKQPQFKDLQAKDRPPVKQPDRKDGPGEPK